METIRRANKEHECDICNGIIRKGNKYTHRQYRFPEHDEYDNQIGIKYQSYRVHSDYCQGLISRKSKEELKLIWKNCTFDNHKWIEEEINDLWDLIACDTGNVVCEYCGIIKSK